MQFSEAFALAKKTLIEAKVPSPEADAYWLLAHATDSTKAEVITRITLDEYLSDDELTSFHSVLSRRAAREPLQHITGKAAFRSIELRVGPGVFIPRFETEQVTQIAIDFVKLSHVPLRVVDVGTGSGAIAISIAKETTAKVYAIEASDEALRFAKENIHENQVDVELIAGDFEKELPRLGQFDLIISNPPYIPLSAVPLEPEVYRYDPEMALYSGEDGLDDIRELVAIASFCLLDGGMLVLEHADGQSDLVRELLLISGFTSVTAHPDPTGRLRAVSGIRRA